MANVQFQGLKSARVQSLIGGDMVNRARAARFRVPRFWMFWSPRQGRVFARGATRIANPSPMRIAPHDEIPPKTHGLVADSKTVASRINRQPPENLALTTLKDSSEGFPFLLQSAQSEG